MSWKITRQDFLNFFYVADENRDGYISMRELRNVLREYGYKGSDSDINVMFHTTDTDGDNLISLDEFWRAMGQLASRKHVLDVFVRVFRRNDDNKDGIVTLLEFRKAMSEIEPYLTKDEYTRLDDMIPLRKRKDFPYLKFKLTVAAVWDSLDQYMTMWKPLDKDKDGDAAVDDVKTVLVEQGYPPKLVDAKVKDLEKDDKISYDEFISVMSEMPAHTHKVAFLRKAFERFDTDGSGTINKTELKKACESLGKSFTDRQIRHIMDKADTDQSGELEYDEFVASIEEILAQEDAYEKFFRDADIDDSGYLSIKELITALRKGGYKGSDDQIRKMFLASDLTADRKISFDEYMVCMGRSPPGDYREAYMRRIFNDYDRNGDGTIDKKEMKSVFKELGKVMSSKEIDRLMAKVDTDGSGSIDYEEFIRATCGK